MWQNYLNALLGLVVLVMSFMGLTGMAMAWTFGILGVLTLIFGLWGGASASSRMESKEHEHVHA